MATGTQNATDANSPLQTQESEMSVVKLQVAASGVNAGDKSESIYRFIKQL